MLRTLLILPLCLWLTLASPKEVGEIVNLDSLWGVWNDSTQADTNRLEAMQDIAWHGNLYSQPDSAYYYAGLVYSMAESIGNKDWMARALNTQGASYFVHGNYDEALEYWFESLNIFEEIGNKRGYAVQLGNIGGVYREQGNYEKALAYYSKPIKIFEEIDDKGGIAWSYSNIGKTYQEQGDFEQALGYHNKSLKIREEIGHLARADSYKNIGLICKEQGNYEKALEYYYKSLKIKEEMDDKSSMATLYNNIGNICKIKGKFDEALAYYDKGLKIAEQLGHKKGISNSYINLAWHSFDENNYTKALIFSKKALDLAQEAGVVIEMRNASEILYKAYKKAQQPAMALEMHELYITMRDSINSIKNKEATIKLEYQHEYEKEKAMDDAKNRAQLEKQQLLTYGTGAGLLLVLGFSLLIFNRFKVTKKQKGVIQQKNKHITESINYARRIQTASLTSKEYLDEVLNEYFIFYQPRDIVSGDFYWTHEIDKDKVMVAVCDCTGHGVPGGFMSMISISLLNEIVVEKGITKVDEVLGELRSQIIRALKQEQEGAEALDGLDMTLLLLDKNKLSVDFAGAGHTLYQTRGKEIIEHKGNSFPVGYFFGREKPYTRKEIKLEKGDLLYMTSDGFTEQFGGKENKLYGIKRFKNLILASNDLSMEEQKEKFSRSYKTWKGAKKQIDDVCLMGIWV